MSESKKGIPFDFFNSKGNPIICETVAEVIEQLKRLPLDLPVNHRFGNGVQLTVYNINDQPHLEFEEADD